MKKVLLKRKKTKWEKIKDDFVTSPQALQTGLISFCPDLQILKLLPFLFTYLKTLSMLNLLSPLGKLYFPTNSLCLGFGAYLPTLIQALKSLFLNYDLLYSIMRSFKS